MIQSNELRMDLMISESKGKAHQGGDQGKGKTKGKGKHSPKKAASDGKSKGAAAS